MRFDRSPSLLALLVLLASPARAQTGVSDDRVSLADGPGSLDGLGDNAAISGNMGQLSYGVDFELPPGFPDARPSLALAYNSGAGSSTVGVGWSMPLPFIERMTSKGFPAYVEDDLFAANGGAQLARVDVGEPAVYRERFEGSFARYMWHDRGSGGEGYWLVESADGNKAYFGAEPDGSLVETARVRSPNGVFRYLLTATEDRFGHLVTYGHAFYGAVPLLDVIDWGFVDGVPRYTVTLGYEDRDDHVSDARGGFNELLTHRLSTVEAYARGTRIRSWALAYESYEDTGGVSRLARVERRGRDGGLYPVVQSFAYSRALGGVCNADECGRPSLTDMGSLGINIATGTATLIDINGDALPDVVDASEPGAPHRFFLNELDADGAQSFASSFASTVGNSGGHALGSPYVQVLDVDGDGFADLLNAQTGAVLMNKGGGDWDVAVTLDGSGAANLPDFGDDFAFSADGQLAHVRFLDANGDRRIDVLRSELTTTELFENRSDLGFTSVSGVDPIGVGFDDERLQLADLNGDGLLDPTVLRVGQVSYRLGLGRGNWTAFVDVSAPLTDADLDIAQLEDMNGDGLDDIVIVLADEVRYAINRNGATFDELLSVSDVDNGSIPIHDSDTTVLFADMNANGSNDIVWIDSSGNVTFLELFPLRPNLLSRIENGVGLVTTITYGTAALQRARGDDADWPTPVPLPMIVVDTFDSFAEAIDPADVVHDVVRYAYAGGFYDGVEKQFRGFAGVDQLHEGDGNQESARVVQIFDVGAGDDRAEQAGLLLEERVLPGDDALGSEAVPFSTQSSTWALCPLAEIPAGLPVDVRFVCRSSSREVIQEQRPESEWVTVDTDYAYDGYGNVSAMAAHGVTSIGGAGCPACDRPDGAFGEPCGAQCLGDETFSETTFVSPENTGGRWLLRAASVSRSFARDGGPASEVTQHYDGAPFEGLPAGSLTRGLLSRVTAATGDTDDEDGDGLVDLVRQRFDEHGNVLERLSPRATIGGEGDRERFTFDESGMLPAREEIEIGAGADAHRLVRDMTFDPSFDLLETITRQYLAAGSSGPIPAGAGDETITTTGYDEHGREIWQLAPGEDTIESPTETTTYEFSSPVSRVFDRRRSVAGGPLDIEIMSCIDGYGRSIEQLARIDDDTWQVTGRRLLNRRGQARLILDPFQTDAPECGQPAPADARAVSIDFDAVGRQLVTTDADDEIYGTPSRSELRYGPLVVESYDADDTDPEADDFDTPTRRHIDGMGRVVRIERVLARGGPPLVHRYTYDDTGAVRSVVDPLGNERVQTSDLLGRVREVIDPDAGRTTYEYDDAGNVVRTTDARGVSLVSELDSLGRVTAQYEEARPTETRIEAFFDRAADCPTGLCAFAAGLPVGSRWPAGDDGVGIDWLSYDARGRPVKAQRAIAGGTFALDTIYDNADRAIAQVFPGGRRIDYAFDAADRIRAIPGFIDEVTYAATGVPERLRYANGVTVTPAYDTALRHVGLRAEGPAGALYEHSLQRGRTGDVVGIDATLASAAERVARATFVKDALGRLVRAEIDIGGNTAESVTYAYDDVDNLTARTSTLGTASIEHIGAYQLGSGVVGPEGAGPHAVTKAGDLALAYDAAGRVTSLGTLGFRLDHLGRATSVTRDGADIARYVYGGFGHDRAFEVAGARRTWTPFPDFEVRDGVSRVIIAVDDLPLAEIESAELAAELLSDLAPLGGDGAITAGDAWLSHVDGAAAATDARTLLRSSARRMLLDENVESGAVGGGTHSAWFVSDHLGSRAIVTDSAGVVTERFDVSPYGGLRFASAVRTESASYAMQEYDEETGLLAFGARLYSPQLGRWLSPDPAFAFATVDDSVGESTSAYGYVGGDPMSAVDPSGQIGSHPGLGSAVKALAYVGVGLALGMFTGGTLQIVGACFGGVAGAMKAVRSVMSDQESFGSQPYSKKQVAFKIFAGFVAGAAKGAINPIGGITSGSVAILGVVAVKYDDYTGKRVQNKVKAWKQAVASFCKKHPVAGWAGKILAGAAGLAAMGAASYFGMPNALHGVLNDVGIDPFRLGKDAGIGGRYLNKILVAGQTLVTLDAMTLRMNQRIKGALARRKAAAAADTKSIDLSHDEPPPSASGHAVRSTDT